MGTVLSGAKGSRGRGLGLTKCITEESLGRNKAACVVRLLEQWVRGGLGGGLWLLCAWRPTSRKPENSICRKKKKKNQEHTSVGVTRAESSTERGSDALPLVPASR